MFGILLVVSIHFSFPTLACCKNRVSFASLVFDWLSDISLLTLLLLSKVGCSAYGCKCLLLKQLNVQLLRTKTTCLQSITVHLNFMGQLIDQGQTFFHVMTAELIVLKSRFVQAEKRIILYSGNFNILLIYGLLEILFILPNFLFKFIAAYK